MAPFQTVDAVRRVDGPGASMRNAADNAIRREGPHGHRGADELGAALMALRAVMVDVPNGNVTGVHMTDNVMVEGVDPALPVEDVVGVAE